MVALVAVNIGSRSVPRLPADLPRRRPEVLRPAADTASHNARRRVLFIFGFIVAATVGCTRVVDLTRDVPTPGHHRTFTACLYWRAFQRASPSCCQSWRPASPSSAPSASWPPDQIDYDGVNVPAGLSRPALDNWASVHAHEVICEFGFDIGPNSDLPRCSTASVWQRSGRQDGPGAPPDSGDPRPGRGRRPADRNFDYVDYHHNFLKPRDADDRLGFVGPAGSDHRLRSRTRTGVALGQRTVPVILMIVLEVILTRC